MGVDTKVLLVFGVEIWKDDNPELFKAVKYRYLQDINDINYIKELEIDLDCYGDEFIIVGIPLTTHKSTDEDLTNLLDGFSYDDYNTEWNRLLDLNDLEISIPPQVLLRTYYY